jgi:hypothetical protein
MRCDQVEARVKGLFLSMIEPALGLLPVPPRVHFWPGGGRRDGPIRAAAGCASPLDMADLKRLCGTGKNVAADTGVIRFTAEGGFRVDKSASGGTSCASWCSRTHDFRKHVSAVWRFWRHFTGFAGGGKSGYCEVLSAAIPAETLAALLSAADLAQREWQYQC